MVMQIRRKLSDAERNMLKDKEQLLRWTAAAAWKYRRMALTESLPRDRRDHYAVIAEALRRNIGKLRREIRLAPYQIP